MPPQWDVQVYFWQMIAKRLTEPRDELLDVILDAWKAGHESTMTSWSDIIYGFLAAGTDTTGASLAMTFSLLAEFEQLEYAQSAIVDDAAAMHNLVEEILRFATAFPMKPLYVL